MHGQPNIKVQRYFSPPPSPYRHRIQPNFLAGGLFATSVATWQVCDFSSNMASSGPFRFTGLQ